MTDKPKEHLWKVAEEAQAKLDQAAKTAGIPPATEGAVNVLQFTRVDPDVFTPAEVTEQIRTAAARVSYHRVASASQEARYNQLSSALVKFICTLVEACPPGPERSTAISRVREAKFWAAAAIAMEGR